MKQRILICRTDSIGDVMLTLPMAFFVKDRYPNAEVYFLGKSYTKDIITRCPWIDVFLNADELGLCTELEQIEKMKEWNISTAIFALPTPHWMMIAAKANVPLRVATGHRWSSWKWATDRLFFSRKKSNLHEAQLNLKLLSPLGINVAPTMRELGSLLPLGTNQEIQTNRLIIHPFSQGSALNWGLQQYDELVGLLKDEPFEIVISGTAKDAELLAQWEGPHLRQVKSVCGAFTLSSFIEFIGQSKALLACSTGPLHLAAAQGVHAVGLYVDRRPIHPGRWSPIGPHVHVIKETDVQQKEILTSPRLVATFLKSIMERPATRH